MDKTNLAGVANVQAFCDIPGKTNSSDGARRPLPTMRGMTPGLTRA
jgi:hypothetical protein